MTCFAPGYQGMRFYRCDLHMHTPADRVGWRGGRLGTGESERRAAAEAYIRRCYETGLEVAAVTDHNFASKEFIPLLRDAIGRLEEQYGYEIVLFPGFEFKAGVGKGLDVLAIFEPGFDLESIDHILTECGVPMPRFTGGVPAKSTERLPKILEIVQRKDGDGGLQGLVILPHCKGDSGIFDSDRIAEWWQAEEFTNPDLYCVEVSKSVEEMSAGWQHLFYSDQGCVPMWRRKRPVAWIMSSDAKALAPAEDAQNFIGFRHTWIKMSQPSIEALRQACLDRESRIRFGDLRPEEAYTYPKIGTLAVTGAAFLADQKIALSPNLTTIIGGRGTGKSTLVEYLRIATGQEDSVRGDEPRKNFQRLRGTIRANTVLRAGFEKEKQRLGAESRGGAPSVVTEGPSAPDLARFLPVRILSQKEIYAIAEDREGRRRLVDDLVRWELDEITRREEDVVREIRRLNEEIASLPQLRDREKILETERQDFEIRLKRLQQLEEPLARWKGFLAEERFFRGLEDEAATMVRSLREAAEGLSFSATTLGNELTQAPSWEVTSRIAGEADRLLETLKSDVEQATARFEQAIASLLGDEQVQAWRQDMELARGAFEKLRKDLAEQGTDPEKYLSYQREQREREVQLTELRKRIEGTEALRQRRDGRTLEDGSREPGLVDELHALWRQATATREEAAARLTAALPRTLTGQPFVQVTVEGYGDKVGFIEKLRQEIRDRRSISQDDWDRFVEAVYAASRQSAEPASPAATLAAWVSELRQGRRPSGVDPGTTHHHLSVIGEWLTEVRLAELQLWRTPDRVKIELYRQDGTLVGELEGPTPLSIGQRCTAVLGLLLAAGDAPVVIDQPEEDLDNEFIYDELVPLLRKVKEQRQVVVVSHNANIPVNGDADLVVALEIRGGHGCHKRVEGRTAVGGLDRREIKLAVQAIMEGSEEAFRRRFEKYGF